MKDKIGNYKFSKERALKIITYIAIACTVGLYIAFWMNPDYYISKTADNAGTSFHLLRIIFVTFFTAFSVLLLLIRNKLTDKLNKILSFLCCAATPVITFLVLEYANIMESTILKNLFTLRNKRALFFSIGILLLILAAAFIISNSTKAAGLFTSIFTCIFGLICYFVYSFRGIPFLASDVTTAGTAFNVMADYQYTLEYEPYILILITFFWCICLCKFRSFKGLGLKLRIPAAVLYILLLAFSIYVLVFTNFLKNRGINVNTFKPEKSYAKNGSIMTVVRSIRYILVDKPENYSVGNADKIAEEYMGADTEEYNTPNVIIIMDEAYADLQSITDFKTNKEVMPFFNSLQENTVRGDMYVSVFGGQTANTEFEVLTGNSKAFLPASSTPYQLFIKEPLPSLNYTLKDQGYQGMIAMHPYHANGYNRQRVYPLLGFDRFLSIIDFEDAKLVRKFVSDESDFERIISEYEASKKESDDPFYLFNVTMQNHSSYTEDFDNFPREITIEDEKYKDEQAERYLSLIHLTDQALEDLIGYFESIEDPTVIVFFGDHVPGIHESFFKKLFGKASSKLSDEELMEKYKVPYFIWANYDMEEKNVNTSSNYLSTLMMESAGMKMSGYNKFLTDIRQEIPVLTANGYWGADGKFYALTDTDSPYYESLNNYNILQYNNMFDKGHRIENFFQ